MKLYRVVARNFVAAYEADGARVIRCAPILRRWLSSGVESFRRAANRYGWRIEEVG